jgi:hypothetical protein
MREMEQLPPDQRAVLSLVLTQGRSYAQVASMLGIPERSVRERAHAALDALARADSAGAANGSVATSPAATASPAAPTAPASATPRARHERTPRPSSRIGGAVLLAAIVAAVVVAVVLLTGSGGKGSGQAASRSTTGSKPSTSTTAAGTGGQVHIDKRLSLASPEPSSKVRGIGFVLSQGGKRAFYVAAQGLAPSSGFFYAVWLYNSPSSSYPLGRAPSVGSNGRLEGGGPLTAPNPGSFHEIVITRETSTHPTAPGQIVLSGPFALR